MRMVRHQGKSVDARAGACGKQPHPIEKHFPVCIVSHDTPLFDSPDNHVMQSSRYIKSRSSWHKRWVLAVQYRYFLFPIYIKFISFSLRINVPKRSRYPDQRPQALPLSAFQSTRPQGARQAIAESVAILMKFQSTRPQGARHNCTGMRLELHFVSIHAPAGGATIIR
jgi:hypothetical protein